METDAKHFYLTSQLPAVKLPVKGWPSLWLKLFFQFSNYCQAVFNEIIGKKQIHNLRRGSSATEGLLGIKSCFGTYLQDPAIVIWVNHRHQGNAFLNVSVPLHSLKPLLWHKIWFCECSNCIQMTNFYVRQILFVGRGGCVLKRSPNSYGYIPKKIQLLLLYPSLRPECWEYVLCLFWWWDHSPSAKRMWNPETYQARREDFHKLCKS